MTDDTHDRPEAGQHENQPANDQPAAEDQSKDQPASDQPAAEDQSKDQPANDQPAAEDQSKDQPASDQPEDADQPTGKPKAGHDPKESPQLDPATFRKAGLTPMAELRARYGENYQQIVKDAGKRIARVRQFGRTVVLEKAEIGGLFERAKQLAAHGDKATVARDFGLHEDTAKRYANLYRYLPWAWPIIQDESAKAEAKGEEYPWAIDHIIRTGRERIKELGIGKQPSRYSGDAKVILIDPAAKTVESIDMPPSFPGSKSIVPHWEQDRDCALAKSFAQSGIAAPTTIWREVGGNAHGYCHIRLAESTVQPETDRLIMLRADKARKLYPITPDRVPAVDFNARKPKSRDVIRLDPMDGTLERISVPDDEPQRWRDFQRTDLSQIGDWEATAGLCLISAEPSSRFAFAIGDQRFKGRAFIARLEPNGEWLTDLRIRQSLGELANAIDFVSLNRLREDDDEPPPPAASEWEELTPERVRDYFGNDGPIAVWREIESDGSIFKSEIVNGQPRYFGKVEAIRQKIAEVKAKRAEQAEEAAKFANARSGQYAMRLTEADETEADETEADDLPDPAYLPDPASLDFEARGEKIKQLFRAIEDALLEGDAPQVYIDDLLYLERAVMVDREELVRFYGAANPSEITPEAASVAAAYVGEPQTEDEQQQAEGEAEAEGDSEAEGDGNPIFPPVDNDRQKPRGKASRKGKGNQATG